MGTADQTPGAGPLPHEATLPTWEATWLGQDLLGTRTSQEHRSIQALPVTGSEGRMGKLCWTPRALENVCGSWFCPKVPHTESCYPASMPSVFGLAVAAAYSLWSHPCPMGPRACPLPGPLLLCEVSFLGFLWTSCHPTVTPVCCEQAMPLASTRMG